MHGLFFNRIGRGRATSFAVVAIAMVFVVLHFEALKSRTEPGHENSSTAGDPLNDELKRCQLIASKAENDDACESAWAKNGRRFFTDTRAPAAQTPESSR